MATHHQAHTYVSVSSPGATTINKEGQHLRDMADICWCFMFRLSNRNCTVSPSPRLALKSPVFSLIWDIDWEPSVMLRRSTRVVSELGGWVGVVLTKDPEWGERCDSSVLCCRPPEPGLGLPPSLAASLARHYYVVEHFRYSADTFLNLHLFTFYNNQHQLCSSYRANCKHVHNEIVLKVQVVVLRER